jgi:hypothetical protein
MRGRSMMRKKSPRNSDRYSPRAALAAVGLKVNSVKLLEPVKQKVVILQKSLRHTPVQKLTDAFLAILAEAHGLSEINTRVRRMKHSNVRSGVVPVLTSRSSRKR